MSMVTNIVMSTGAEDGLGEGLVNEGVDQLNSVLALGYLPELVPLDGHVRGGKAFESSLWACAYNYLHTEHFLKLVCSIPWKQPQYVQVGVQEQEADRFVWLTGVEQIMEAAREGIYAELWALPLDEG